MIPASVKAKRTSNPIRNIVDNLNPPQNHPKKLLNLALGDPTVHGNLHCPVVLEEAVKSLLSVGSANGYIPSSGSTAAKKAIAQYNSTPGYTVHEEDVVIGSGCSGAIDLVLTGLLNEGDNILVPRPAFPLYQVISESLGCHVKYYPLLVSVPRVYGFFLFGQQLTVLLRFRRTRTGNATWRRWMPKWTVARELF